MNYIKIEPLLNKSTAEWLELFLSSIRTRPSYHLDESTFRFQRISLRVLGIPLDEDEYYNSLYDMHQKPFIHVLSEELDKTIDNQVFQTIQDVLNLHRTENKGLSIKRLIAIFYGKNLIPKHTDSTINRHVQISIIKVVEHFKDKQKSGLLSPEFRRFIIDMIKWLKNHWEKWSKDLQIGSDFPKVVWYGDLSLSQQYFLLLLMEFGCDVLILHPAGTDFFSDLDRENEFSLPYVYTNKGKLEPFPTKERERQTTVAYRANKQLEIMLNDHESGIYKPWQFRNFKPSSTTLRMTYDDVFIYAKEKAMIRPQFKIDKDRVIIPVIFTKINGVSRDRADYWSKMKGLKDSSLSKNIREFPFTTKTKANYHFHFQHSLDKDGALSPEKMLAGNWWRYGNLPIELQRAIAWTIKEYCEHPKLLKLNHETEYDLQLFLFKQASLIPEDFLKQLQQFDYSQDVPRIVLYNMGTNSTFTREDAALLLFLNEFGVDIVLYHPAGQTDIENFVDPSHYDTHWLEDIVFEQEIPDFQQEEKSFIKKIIKRIF
ncbi:MULTISPECIES: YceG family protein [unclassified Bacillus (in: firmicutes)]|uniref:YceG family protein n=1 Tax=unclassified Bacillus (in: firmicutes) TaxID=185979 RepID=UPI00080AF086|nr:MULTISPECIES: YceG family protein [unclassified Bacillus (in: firmicutes)]OCA86792.1 hypothetical protein A8L44_05800 [Bacillus sp. FJAT-27986]